MRSNLYIRYLISFGLSIIGILLTWFGVLKSQVHMWIGIGVIAIGVIISWTIRCPHCSHGLTGRGILFLPEICPNCGHKIFESELE